MFIFTKSLPSNCFNAWFFQQVRFKSKEHWAKAKRKITAKHKALNHFDDFYGSVFGEEWDPMKKALLRRSKYVAVVNNYGDTEHTIELLKTRGAHCLKELIKVQQDFHNEYSPKHADIKHKPESRVENYIERLQSEEASNIYPQSNSPPPELDINDITILNGKKESITNNENIPITRTLEQSLADAELDDSRVIDPSMGFTSETLYQFVPATKLKGMEDWIPDSLHYSFYSKGQDFPLVIEAETEFNYPEHLKVYTYEMDSEWDTFPEPKRCQTGVFNYYPMDMGSVMAALALCLRGGERVLDLCAAPGGKALVALQTLLPDIVVCNDASISRTNRLHRMFRDYLFDFDTSNKWRERVLISSVDGRLYIDEQGFDKVLVDVPCTTDRHSVNEDENNIFRADRVKERLKIPELQSQLLSNALKLVKVGGAVVYSTCSLSPIQNDGVVHMALKNVFENHGILAVVKDLSSSMSGFSSTLQLCSSAAAPKYGQLVKPVAGANFGPSYIARLVRVR